jgi:acetyltransferase-like isoleucine patch superfamily enzyme
MFGGNNSFVLKIRRAYEKLIEALFAHEDPMWIGSRTFRRLYNILVNRTYPFAANGGRLWVDYTCELDRATAHRIRLGYWVRLRGDVRLEVLATPHESGEPLIILDDLTDIGPRSIISAKNRIHLEREVTSGQSVLIMDHDYAHEDIATPVKNQGVTKGGRIRIEEGCFIGQGAVIRCNQGELVLGRHCVVAANALVTRSFPPYCLVAGNPARVVQQFDPVTGDWTVGRSRLQQTPQTS